MGMYSNYDVQYDGTPSETIDSIMSDSSVIAEDYTDIKEYGLNILTTMTINYNLIHEHIAFAELKHITESGIPMVYTEGVFSSIFNAIKRFLQKIWERIKGLFKRFMMIINSYSKTDKEFANKYRKEIFAYHDLSDFTFKGYKWTIEEEKIRSAIEKCATTSKSATRDDKFDIKPYDTHLTSGTTPEEIRKALEKFDDVVEGFRGECIKELGGRDGKYSSDEFRKELKICFRNGEDEKEELDDKDLDVHDMFAWLIGSKDAKKTIDRMFKENKRVIDEEIKILDSKQKDMANDMPVKNPKGTSTDLYNSTTKTQKITINDVMVWKNGKPLSIADYTANLDTATAKTWNALITAAGSANAAFQLVLAHSDNHTTERVNIDVSKQVGVNVDITNEDDRKRHALQLQYDMKNAHMTKECLIEIDTAALDAIKERSRQYKACLIKIVHHKGKSETAYTESAAENDYFFKSNPVDAYLGSITFK